MEGKPKPLRDGDAWKWRAALQTGVPVMEPANFYAEATFALDVADMEAIGINWSQYDNYAVSTLSELIP
eukprot:4489931-Karenia_brevis.AAC.1